MIFFSLGECHHTLKKNVISLDSPHLLYNENFNCTEFDIIKNMSGNNNFVLSVDNILIKLSF